MKMKITRYFAMLAAVAGLSSACQEELEHVVYNPEDVVAPVLNAVEDINITVDELSTGNVKFTWEAADFGVATQVYYTLDMSAEVNGDVKTVNVFKNASGTEGSASYEKINGHLLYDFEFAAGVSGEVSFTLYASLKVGQAYASNVVKANAVAAVAERTYPTVWVIGNYCGWDHSKTQFLYDFAGTDDVYSGLVDFADQASTGFKLTGIAGWDDACNWGEETKATEADEPAKVQLITGGGSQDIMRYAKRFYGFSFSKSTLELTKNYGFDKVAVIGLNNDWENDIEMNFNSAAQKQVFYVDVEVAAATEFKFRMDGGWDLNFGGDIKALTQGGDNIKIEPGNYRIYLNMNNPAAVTCSLDTRMYGKEEGGAATPEPEPEPEPTPDPELPEGARAINILCVNPGWEAANLYGWEAATAFTWPGVAATGKATLNETEYFYWTLEAANWGKTPGLIFNNGTVQTVDITGVTLDGDKAFKLGEANSEGKLAYEAVENPVIRITYKNEAAWEAVNLYGWGDEGVSFGLGDWPGTSMTKEGDVWVCDLPVEHLGKSVFLIFNNGSGAQTKDLGPFVLDKDYVFDNTNAEIK